MGDMADYYVGLGLANGENPYAGYSRREAPHREPKSIRCNRCCSTEVRWVLCNGRYVLFDRQRAHPGNRFIQHLCPTSADSFGDVTDA